MALSQKRLIQLFAFLAAWAVVVVVRLIQVQVVRHEHYTDRAQRQQEDTVELLPVRGSILDVRGRVLAQSIPAESICADPQAISDRRAVARALASVKGLRMTARQVEAKLRGNRSFAYIARQVPLEVSAEVRKLHLPGIYFLDAHRRSYPRAELAANVVGYTGVDGEGLGGIEHALDSRIRGSAGRVTLLKDARKGFYVVGGDGPNRARDGDHVVLTIDSVVQFIAERSLAKAIDQYGAVAGTVIVMDPRDGAILAMASAPTFDPNRFREFPPDAWRNRNVQDIYEPGSTFKIVTAAAGLEEGVVTPSQIIDCGNGSITVGNITIREHGGHHWSFIPFSEVLAHSSNVGTIRVGMALGQNRFYDYIRRFGFGERSGITLPGEQSGLVRRTEKWSMVSNASISIGQEIGTTPLQVVRAVAAVANGGVRVEPRIVDRVVDGEGKTVHRPQPAAPVRVISEKTAAVLNELLKNVVANGTGEHAELPEHIVAGKTGTAQKAMRGGYSPDKVVASFAGYVPADRPRLVILVVIDEPSTGQYGGTVAAPAFREIAESTLRYLGVEPSLPARTLDLGAPRLADFSQKKPARQTTSGVPDLRGMDARAAAAAAVASGLVVRVVGSGVVTSQNPIPGGALPDDRRITLILGREVVRTSRAEVPSAVAPREVLR